MLPRYVGCSYMWRAYILNNVSCVATPTVRVKHSGSTGSWMDLPASARRLRKSRLVDCSAIESALQAVIRLKSKILAVTAQRL